MSRMMARRPECKGAASPVQALVPPTAADDAEVVVGSQGPHAVGVGGHSLDAALQPQVPQLDSPV